MPSPHSLHTLVSIVDTSEVKSALSTGGRPHNGLSSMLSPLISFGYSESMVVWSLVVQCNSLKYLGKRSYKRLTLLEIFVNSGVFNSNREDVHYPGQGASLRRTIAREGAFRVAFRLLEVVHCALQKVDDSECCSSTLNIHVIEVKCLPNLIQCWRIVLSPLVLATEIASVRS
jgi:hypothetical protein